MVFLCGVRYKQDYFIHYEKSYKTVRNRHRECRCTTWAWCLDSLMFGEGTSEAPMKYFTPRIQKYVSINAREILP